LVACVCPYNHSLGGLALNGTLAIFSKYYINDRAIEDSIGGHSSVLTIIPKIFGPPRDWSSSVSQIDYMVHQFVLQLSQMHPLKFTKVDTVTLSTVFQLSVDRELRPWFDVLCELVVFLLRGILIVVVSRILINLTLVAYFLRTACGELTPEIGKYSGNAVWPDYLLYKVVAMMIEYPI